MKLLPLLLFIPCLGFGQVFLLEEEVPTDRSGPQAITSQEFDTSDFPECIPATYTILPSKYGRHLELGDFNEDRIPDFAGLIQDGRTIRMAIFERDSAGACPRICTSKNLKGLIEREGFTPKLQGYMGGDTRECIRFALESDQVLLDLRFRYEPDQKSFVLIRSSYTEFLANGRRKIISRDHLSLEKLTISAARERETVSMTKREARTILLTDLSDRLIAKHLMKF